MRRIVIGLAAFAFVTGCGNKRGQDSVGSGAVAPAGSGSGSGSSGSGSSGSGSGDPGSWHKPDYAITGLGSALPPLQLGPGEVAVRRTPLVDLVEHGDRAKDGHRAFSARGANGAFAIDLDATITGKDEPAVGEFPIAAPKHRNLNTTSITFHAGAAAVELSVVNLDEIAKAGALTPADLTAAYDAAQAAAIADRGYAVAAKSDDNIAGSPARAVSFTGTRASDNAKIEGRLWLVQVAKANAYLQLQVVAPPKDAMLATAETYLKSLTITR